MTVETLLRPVHTEFNPMPELQEVEKKSNNPMLLLGGGSGSGKAFGVRYAHSEHDVYFGTRSVEKFERIHSVVDRIGGNEAKPFIADIKDEEQSMRAIDAMNLPPGQSVDYFAFAAEGMQAVGIPVGRALMGLKVKLRRNGHITKKEAIDATNKLKEVMQNPERHVLANATNSDAPVRIMEELINRGHINSESKVAILSSMISDYTEPDKLEEYPGPWLYYPIGRSKAEGRERLKTLSESKGATFIDFVAQDIRGTEVGNFFAGFEDVFDELQKLHADTPLGFSYITRADVSYGIISELAKDDRALPKSRKVYLGPGGTTQYDKPDNFHIPVVPFL